MNLFIVNAFPLCVMAGKKKYVFSFFKKNVHKSYIAT